jgi:hypothetical protein
MSATWLKPEAAPPFSILKTKMPEVHGISVILIGHSISQPFIMELEDL